MRLMMVAVALSLIGGAVQTTVTGAEGKARTYTLAEKSIQHARENLPKQVSTENPELTKLVHDLYRDCTFDKLWEPALPGLPYRFFSISGAGDKSYAKCQLLWDTMFVLNAWAPLDDNELVCDVFRNYWNVIDNNPEAPKGSVRYGMVPCTTKPDLPQDGFSQIPILAWGCLMVYNQTHDLALLELCIPYLDSFLTWYATERDVDNDGLIEYGAYKKCSISDIVQTARFETFDFALPLDGLKLTKHPSRDTGGEWYGNIEGVDQTCFLAMSERAMIEMCQKTGRIEWMKKYERRLAKRTEAVRAKMWDPETKFFYSLDRDTDKPIRVRTLQGFLPLTAGMASEKQAAELVRQLTDPSLFWSKYPVTTSAMNEPTFRPDGFWRGDVWPPTNYLIQLGLNRYGYHDLAREMADKMLELVRKHDGHAHERYNGVEGLGLGVKDYCWGVSIWSMIVNAHYGVQEDYRTIVVPPNAKARKLKLGKLEVSYLTDTSVELRTAFQREFKVVFPDKNGEIKVQCDGAIVKSVCVTGSISEVTFTALAGKTYVVSKSEPSSGKLLAVKGGRFLTLNTVIRVNQIEAARNLNEGTDEGDVHTPETVAAFRDAVTKGFPGAKVTWAFSWLALHDERPNYVAIRKQVAGYHKTYGDEVTFIPGGFFAPMYSSRAQVNLDIKEALLKIRDMVGGGYKPKSLVAGFLSAENLRYLAEEEGIHVCQGTIWSQYGIDNGDGDGSISYPYYPSREHACKPAQGKDDFIDCVNLDGWTCDFLCARRFGFEGGFNSRLGVGPIESYRNLGLEKGMAEVMAVTANHFDEGFKRNGFGWVVNCWEISLVKNLKPEVLPCLTQWLQNVRQRWPDAQVVTQGEFGEAWRREYPDNKKLDYTFVQRGTGIGGSETNLEIRWFMNPDFRLAILRDWQENEPGKVIDFTRYDLPAREPADPTADKPTRNWSLINRINQKQRRTEDAPVLLKDLTQEEQALIRKRYPELF
jgi:hypothetical protein